MLVSKSFHKILNYIGNTAVRSDSTSGPLYGRKSVRIRSEAVWASTHLKSARKRCESLMVHSVKCVIGHL